MRRKFVLWFVGAAVAIAAALASFAIWMERLGEAAPQEIIARQRRSANTVLFASGIDGEFSRYKLSLLERLQPRIAAVGSSRAMQVRAEFFKGDFANLGGLVTSLASLEAAVEKLTSAARRPQLLLVFGDIWWFNGTLKRAQERPPQTQPWRRVDPGRINQAMNVLMTNAGKVPTLLPPPTDRLGLLAIMADQGFDLYGSYFYISTVTGGRTREDLDYQFAETERRVRAGTDRFEHAAHADVAAIERFATALEKLRAAGIHVVLIFPPFAARVNEMMAQEGGYEYVPDLLRQLSARGLQPLNYHDLRPQQHGLSKPDCEFVDGFHGGDVAYARVIRDAVDRDPELQMFVDVPTLDFFIAANAGLAQGVRKFLRGARETDFLGLGCERPRPTSDPPSRPE